MQHGRRWTLWVGVLTIMGVLAVGIGPSAVTGALAQTGAEPQIQTAQCSLATLKGTYLFAEQGVEIVAGDRVPLAVAGYEVYDGKGKVNVVASASVNGEITRNLRLSGEYTVNTDCTGTYTTRSPGGNLVHLDLFIAPDGSQFTFIQTDPGVVVSGFEPRATAKRAGD